MAMRNTINWSSAAVQQGQQRLWEAAQPVINAQRQQQEQHRRHLSSLWANIPEPPTCVLLTAAASRRISAATITPNGTVPLDGVLEAIEGEMGRVRIYWFSRHDLRYRRGGEAISELVWVHRRDIERHEFGIITPWDPVDMSRCWQHRAGRLRKPGPPPAGQYWVPWGVR